MKGEKLHERAKGCLTSQKSLVGSKVNKSLFSPGPVIQTLNS